jgi:hypothetical protein
MSSRRLPLPPSPPASARTSSTASEVVALPVTEAVAPPATYAASVNGTRFRSVFPGMEQNWSKGRQATAFTGTALLVLGGGMVALGLRGSVAEPVVNLAATQDSSNILVSHAALGRSLPTYYPSPNSVPTASTPPVGATTAPAAAPIVPPTNSAAKSATVTQNTTKPPTRAAAPAPTTAPPPANEAVTVSGYIECQSQSVEGVWIQAANSDSGFAPWWPSADNPDYATYQYTLDSGGQYAVHVGCGGTQDTWAVATYSDFFSGPVNDFYCYDNGGADNSYCARVGS